MNFISKLIKKLHNNTNRIGISFILCTPHEKCIVQQEMKRKRFCMLLTHFTISLPDKYFGLQQSKTSGQKDFFCKVLMKGTDTGFF